MSLLESQVVGEAKTQLETIIDRIVEDRSVLIRIVTHMLHEVRQRRQTSTAQHQLTISTPSSRQMSARTPVSSPLLLYDLIPSDSDSKRKRQGITHYEGIPICIIYTPPPSRDDLARRVVTPKRMMRLDRAMAKVALSCPADPQISKGTAESEDETDDEDEDEDEDFVIIV